MIDLPIRSARVGLPLVRVGLPLVRVGLPLVFAANCAWGNATPTQDLQEGVALARDGRHQDALPPLFRSATSGNPYAQFNLALCLYLGRGAAQDREHAVEWWLKAAEQGLPQAQYNLGLCYATGQGVARNPEAAVFWWKKAADLGMQDAAYNLALCFYSGFGTGKDDSLAQYYFRKAGASAPPTASQH